MKILTCSEWAKLQPDVNFRTFKNKYEQYNIYVEETKEKIIHINKTGGYPNCHCNNCIESIEKYKGYKKYDMFIFRGHNIYIKEFCPLENCKNIFVTELNTSYCEWASIEEAQREFISLNKSIIDYFVEGSNKAYTAKEIERLVEFGVVEPLMQNNIAIGYKYCEG
jgi:hypothetical protein